MPSTKAGAFVTDGSVEVDGMIIMPPGDFASCTLTRNIRTDSRAPVFPMFTSNLSRIVTLRMLEIVARATAVDVQHQANVCQIDTHLRHRSL